MAAITNPAVALTLVDLRRNVWHVIGRRRATAEGNVWEYTFLRDEVKQFRAMRDRGAIVITHDHRVSPIALLAKLAG